MAHSFKTGVFLRDIMVIFNTYQWLESNDWTIGLEGSG